MRGFRKTQASLQKHLSSPKNASRTFAPGGADPTVRMVRAAVRHSIGHPTCLEESLALWWLLGCRGISSELRIGVRKHDERFEAHAWVECEGMAVNEPLALHEHYAAFDEELSSVPPEPR